MATPQEQWSSWTWQQTNAIKSFSKLRETLPWVEENLEETSRYFQFQVTPYYLSLMNPQDPQDPIAKICIPSLQELHILSDEMKDPTGDFANNEDLKNSPVKGIVHRYPDRCLLLVTPYCASYCRYCFRREVVAKAENNTSLQLLDKALEYIRQTPDLREVILTGGDPLVLGDEKLAAILSQLNEIKHLRSLRIHTKFPVFNPFRITDSLVEVFAKSNKQLWMVLHVTHPQEVTEDLKAAVQKMKQAGVGLLNQSVLIKDCNDNVETLKELSYILSECGIVPQYLHMMDRAQGTSHFRVPLIRAQELMAQLRGHLSGFLIPQLVLDIPGGYGKIPVESSFFTQVEENGERYYQVQSPILKNKTFIYKDN